MVSVSGRNMNEAVKGGGEAGGLEGSTYASRLLEKWKWTY